MCTELDDRCEIDGKRARAQPPAEKDSQAAAPQLEPLRSVHTASFPQILSQCGISLLVTTYQAGRLVVLRAQGGVLNTHFRGFPKPMGLAVRGNRLAIGLATEICEYHNLPAVAPKVQPAGTHDACFLAAHGLCHGRHPDSRNGLDRRRVVVHQHGVLVSLHPQRRLQFSPPLAAAVRQPPGPRRPLSPERLWDWSTARFATSRPWARRTRPAAGGPTNATAASSSTSPPTKSSPADCRCHIRPAGTTAGCGCWNRARARSARWIRARAATNRLPSCRVIPAACRSTGRLAFVGLSQVRESAVFSGIPLVERLQERTCGVWVVNIHTGETVAFLKFEDAVQEIFAVEVLPGMRYPDVITDNKELLAGSFVLPDDALADVPESMRARVPDDPDTNVRRSDAPA